MASAKAAKKCWFTFESDATYDSTERRKQKVLILQKHDGMKAFLASARMTTVLAVVLSTALVSAQTRITPPKNNYTAEQDVQLGREASVQVRQELPILHDDAVTSYVQD